MNPNENEDYWNSSEIKNLRFNFDDAEENQSQEKPTNSNYCSKPEAYFLSDLVSNISVSEQNERKSKSKVDLYSLISEKSINYILNFENFIESHSARIHKDEIKETIEKLIKGYQNISLEKYKSLKSKKLLLKYALESKNYNTVLKIMLFLIKTLKSNFIHEIFLNNKITFIIYIQFLINKKNYEQAIELYNILGFNKNVGLLKYQTINNSNINLISNLKLISNSYFLNENDKIYFDHLINLLEFYQLINQTTTTTTTDSFKYLIQINDIKHINYLIKLLNINDYYYDWIFLLEKSKSQQWQDISCQFISVKWFKIKKLVTLINVEDIIKHISINNAPENIKSEYFQFVSDVSRKLFLGMKYNCVHIVVDILVEQRDRQSLLQYKVKQIEQSEGYFYVENALRNNDITWKN